MALDRARQSGAYEVTTLITTVNPEFGRVSMHGVREDLVQQQADAIGLPLERMLTPSSSTNQDYVSGLRHVLAAQRDAGVKAIVFGDIFLADLRAWREGFLAEAGLEGVFPLWGEDTRGLAGEFVKRGFKAVTCCVDDAHLTEQAVGQPMDSAFFASLPPQVDPCGENGEYHSFVHDGPVFARPIPFRLGERVYRPLGGAAAGDGEDDEHHPRISVPAGPAGTRTKGFWFVDLLPA